MTIEQIYDTMKGNMTDTPNVETVKGRAQARAQNIAYDVTVNEIRYTWSIEQRDRLRAEIPQDAIERVPFE